MKTIKSSYDKTANENKGVLLDNSQYQKLLGSLLFISVNTPPDVSASISILAQQVLAPRQVDWNELKRVLKYLRAISNIKLVLGDKDNNSDLLYGYADANWAESRADWKSNGGYVFIVNAAIVSWSCRKHSLRSS